MNALTKTLYSKFLYLNLGLCLIILLNSCGSSPEYVRYIPEKSAYVVSINLDHIQSKATNWKQLFSKEFLQSVRLLKLKEGDDLASMIENSGIDFKSIAYSFADVNPQDIQDSYSATLFKLRDESLFAEFIKNLPDLKTEVQKEEKISICQIRDNMALAWLNNVAILLTTPKASDAAKMTEKINELFNLPKEESLLEKNQDFKTLQAEKFDLAVWLNISRYEKSGERFLSSLTPFTTPIKLEDNYLGMTIHFEKGEIIANTKYSMNQSFDQFKNFFKKEVNSSHLSAFPIKNPLSVLVLGLSPEGIQEGMKGNGLMGLIATFVKKPASDLTGVSLDELIGLFTGDVFYVLKNIDEIEVSTNNIDQDTGEPMVETTYQMDFQFIVGLHLKDKEKMKQILIKMSESDRKGGIIAKDDYFVYEPAPGNAYYLFQKEDILFVTTSEALRGDLIRKNSNKMDSKLNELGKGNSMALYLDLQKDARKKLPALLFKDKSTEILVRNLDTPFENLIMNIPFTNNDKINGKIVISVDEKEKNTLETLIDFIINAGKSKRRAS